MLREIFRTVNVPYKKIGDVGAENDGAFIGFNYGANKPPYVETVSSWTGLTCKVQWAPATYDQDGPDKYATPYGAGSIYLFATMGTNKWPSWDFGYWRFDIKKGKFRLFHYERRGQIIKFAIVIDNGCPGRIEIIKNRIQACLRQCQNLFPLDHSPYLGNILFYIIF